MTLDLLCVRLAEYPLVALGVVWAVLALTARKGTVRARNRDRFAARLGVLALVAYGTLALWYLALGTYADHAEPTIPAIAWSFWRGAPIYHAPDAGPRYSLIYGPVLYELHALVLGLVGPSIVSSKVTGVVAAFGAMVLTWVALAARTGRPQRLALVGAMAVAALVFRNATFWTRAEPLLLLTSAAGLVAAARFQGVTRALSLGLLTGVAFGLKVTGPVYMLPALAAAFADEERVAWLVAAAALAAGTAVAASYAFPGVSATNHWHWFALAAANGLRRTVLVQNLQYTCVFAVAVAAGAIASRRTHAPREYVTQAWTLLALGLIGVLASKPGGGAYHLAPMLPSVALAATPALGPGGTAGGRMALRAVGWTVLVLAVTQQVYYLRKVIPANATRADLDVGKFLTSHPSASTAVGYGGAYRETFVRPLPVFQGRSLYLLDAAALMEIELSGLPLPPATVALVKDCAVDYWLIPSGDRPFTLPSAYTGRDVFSVAFREAFHHSYRRAGSTRLFDVWQCSRQPGDTP